jgi:transcriptional regulator with XRE-family HTH domain
MLEYAAMTNLREMVRLYRLANRYTARRLARDIGITTATLYRIERGGRTVSADTLVKLLNWMVTPPVRRSYDNPDHTR